MEVAHAGGQQFVIQKGGDALSGDTLVVGAHQEDGGATGIDGDQIINTAADSGAIYVFGRL